MQRLHRYSFLPQTVQQLNKDNLGNWQWKNTGEQCKKTDFCQTGKVAHHLSLSMTFKKRKNNQTLIFI